MQQVRQTRGKGEGIQSVVVSDMRKKRMRLVGQPSLVLVAFRRSWYHIEGRGSHTVPFFHAAFWYRIVVIMFVIIVAILIFRLDVSLTEENVVLYGTLVSMMGASACESHLRG
jgi:hypothetical protein